AAGRLALLAIARRLLRAGLLCRVLAPHADAVVAAVGVGAARRAERSVADDEARARVADLRTDADVEAARFGVAVRRARALRRAEAAAVRVRRAVLRPAVERWAVEIELAGGAVGAFQ